MANKPPKNSKDTRLARAGVEGFNKPKKTPNHPTKSHVVVAKVGEKIKTLRFGEQGETGKPPKAGESKQDAADRKAFKDRFAKGIAKKDKLSAIYWSNKVKW